MLSLKLSKVWGWNSLPGACSDLDLTILSGDIWRQLTAASRQTVRSSLRSADWSLSAHARRPHRQTWLDSHQDGRQNIKCLYFRVRSRIAGDGDREGAVGCRLSAVETQDRSLALSRSHDQIPGSHWGNCKCVNYKCANLKAVKV